MAVREAVVDAVKSHSERAAALVADLVSALLSASQGSWDLFMVYASCLRVRLKRGTARAGNKLDQLAVQATSHMGAAEAVCELLLDLSQGELSDATEAVTSLRARRQDAAPQNIFAELFAETDAIANMAAETTITPTKPTRQPIPVRMLAPPTLFDATGAPITHSSNQGMAAGLRAGRPGPACVMAQAARLSWHGGPDQQFARVHTPEALRQLQHDGSLAPLPLPRRPDLPDGDAVAMHPAAPAASARREGASAFAAEARREGAAALAARARREVEAAFATCALHEVAALPSLARRFCQCRRHVHVTKIYYMYHIRIHMSRFSSYSRNESESPYYSYVPPSVTQPPKDSLVAKRLFIDNRDIDPTSRSPFDFKVYMGGNDHPRPCGPIGYDNVVSVELKGVSFPKIANERYVILSIDELNDDLLDSTSQAAHNAFAIIYFDSDALATGTVKPCKGTDFYMKQLFFRPPLAQLNKLSVKFLKNDGSVVTGADTNGVTHISLLLEITCKRNRAG
jgi:hypothetical protein